jgi:hypothetical protein
MSQSAMLLLLQKSGVKACSEEETPSRHGVGPVFSPHLREWNFHHCYATKRYLCVTAVEGAH